MNKCILITGCAGFIGSNLSKKLLEDPNNLIIGIDNLSTARYKNLFELSQNNNFEFIIKDLSHEKELDLIYKNILDITDKHKIEISEIYHAASPASPPKYDARWEETIKVNTAATFKLLKIAQRTGSKFMFFSTSEVYGDPEVVPQKEEYNGNVKTICRRSCYDEAKRLGETITYEHYRRYSVDVKIPRIHNTYGPGMRVDDGRVITNFIKQAVSNGTLTIYGDGSQIRCLTYVDDMVDGLIKLMDGDYHEPINLGSDKPISVKDLAYKIHKAVNKFSVQFPHVYYPLPEGDPIKRLPDISKAKQILNWSPTTSLDKGLTKTIDFVKMELSQ